MTACATVAGRELTPAEWFARYPELSRTPLFTLRVPMGIVGDNRIVTIRAYEGPFCPPNHTRLYCELLVSELGRDGKKKRRAPLFPRESFWVGVPSHQSIDSAAAREAALSLFAMKPGDTDSDFFSHYTSEQLAFVTEHGEWLSLVAEERYGTR